MITVRRRTKYDKVTLYGAHEARVGDIPDGREAPIISIVAIDPAMAKDCELCAVLADGTTWRMHRGQTPETVMRPVGAEQRDPLVDALARLTSEEARVIVEMLAVYVNGSDNQATFDAVRYFHGVAQRTRDVDYDAVSATLRERLTRAGILEPRADRGHRLTAAGAELARTARDPETIGRAVRNAENADHPRYERAPDPKLGWMLYTQLRDAYYAPESYPRDDGGGSGGGGGEGGFFED